MKLMRLPLALEFKYLCKRQPLWDLAPTPTPTPEAWCKPSFRIYLREEAKDIGK